MEELRPMPTEAGPEGGGRGPGPPGPRYFRRDTPSIAKADRGQSSKGVT